MCRPNRKPLMHPDPAVFETDDIYARPEMLRAWIAEGGIHMRTQRWALALLVPIHSLNASRLGPVHHSTLNPHIDQPYLHQLIHVIPSIARKLAADRSDAITI